jgi:hypothetical protein
MDLSQRRTDAGRAPDVLSAILRGWYDPDSAGFDPRKATSPARELASSVRRAGGDAEPVAETRSEVPVTPR